MSSVTRERASFLVLKEEIQGEKFFYYLRWLVVLFEIVIVSVLTASRHYVSTHYYAYGFIAVTTFYNTYLFIVFKHKRYRSSIKFFSIFVYLSF